MKQQRGETHAFTKHSPKERPPEARGTDRCPARRGDAAALWKRLDLLNRSQNWLAGEVGVSPAYVSMLVNGGRSPSGRIRRRTRKALGVTNSKELFKTEEKHERP